MSGDQEKNITSDFGHYLANVAERDVDLLLMEEFHASNDFVTWFCAKVGLTDVRGDGAWHSVSDVDGETDLLLRVIAGGKRIGVLVENKIGAPEQAQQDQRYHLRAARAQEQGKFDAYVTVMCAPQRYLSALSTLSAYQYRVSYEDIADWFGTQLGRRAAWRRHIMHEAIEQSRRGYQVIPHPVNTEFHHEYWEHVRANHPHIVMARPVRARGKNSNWIVLKGRDFPPNIQIDHLLRDGIVRLSFFGRTIDDLVAIRPDWPGDVRLIKKPKSAVLAIPVPLIDMEVSFETQIMAIDEALRAAHRLMSFVTIFDGAKYT